MNNSQMICNLCDNPELRHTKGGTSVLHIPCGGQPEVQGKRRKGHRLFQHHHMVIAC